MSNMSQRKGGIRTLLQGNEAIARGALEAGVLFCSGYPGNPSSEIIESLAAASKDLSIYVEWSVNEKVALEAATAASFATSFYPLVECTVSLGCILDDVDVVVLRDFRYGIHICGLPTIVYRDYSSSFW